MSTLTDLLENAERREITYTEMVSIAAAEFEKLISRITALEAELAEVKRWISVEESVPDDGIEVLIWTSEGANIGVFDHGEDGPCLDGEVVKWWRPLPYGPEEK